MSEANKDKHVLVVEDDTALRAMVGQMLANRYTVHRAADAGKARALLEKLPHVDVIVSDIMMPGVNGLQFARWVKGQKRFAHVAIVFLTARSAALDVVEGINAGARFYVAKPFKVTELLDKVARAANVQRVAGESA